MIERLTPELRAAFAAAAVKWQSGERTGRIWEGDSTVWTGRDEAYWLGWLDAPEREAARLGEIGGKLEHLLQHAPRLGALAQGVQDPPARRSNPTCC